MRFLAAWKASRKKKESKRAIKRSDSEETHDTSVASRNHDVPVTILAAEEGNLQDAEALFKGTESIGHDATTASVPTKKEHAIPVTAGDKDELTDKPLKCNERNAELGRMSDEAADHTAEKYSASSVATNKKIDVILPPSCVKQTSKLGHRDSADDDEEDMDVSLADRSLSRSESDVTGTLLNAMTEESKEQTRRRNFGRDTIAWLSRKGKASAGDDALLDDDSSGKISKAVQQQGTKQRAGWFSFSKANPLKDQNEQTEKEEMTASSSSVSQTGQKEGSKRSTEDKRKRSTHRDDEYETKCECGLFVAEMAKTCFFFQCLGHCVGEEGQKVIEKRGKDTTIFC